MPRPTQSEAARLKRQMLALVEQGLSVNQIGRITGKSGQAVHQYLKAHDLETSYMRRRRMRNLDKVTSGSDGEAPPTERTAP